jgi:hypothetical protein
VPHASSLQGSVLLLCVFCQLLLCTAVLQQLCTAVLQQLCTAVPKQLCTAVLQQLCTAVLQQLCTAVLQQLALLPCNADGCCNAGVLHSVTPPCNAGNVFVVALWQMFLQVSQQLI